MHPYRGRTTSSTWPSAIHENFYERPSDDPSRLEIWCYTDRLSYAPGEIVRFHVSTSAPRFDLTIQRDGTTLETVFVQEGLEGSFHPTPGDCSVDGCGWPVAFELEVPADWRSGGYLVTVRARDESGTEAIQHHVFVLRPAKDGPRAPLLMIASSCTWTAYNDWGGSNHYEGITGPEAKDFSPILSTQRPISRGFAWLPEGAPRVALQQAPPPGAAPRYPHMEWAYANGFSKKYASAGWASYDRHFLRWAEAAGYQVDLASQHDLHYRPGLLDGYKGVIFVGHDEYWSWDMRDAVDRYVEGGGRVARFAGNFLWQIRLEDEGRRQVCYKYRALAEDPLAETDRHHLTTSCWEAAPVGRPGAATFGLTALRGVYAGWGGCCPRGAGGFTVYRPEHWLFAGTDLYYGDLFGSEARIFGYEVDGLDYEIRGGLPYPTGVDGEPEGLEILAMGLATTREEDHGNPGTDLFIGEEDAHFKAKILHGEATPETVDRVTRGSGMIVVFSRGAGEVVHAGTCEWVAGLKARDATVERVTRNVLDRFLQS